MNLKSLIKSFTALLCKSRPAYILSLFRFSFCLAILYELWRSMPAIKARVEVLSCGSIEIFECMGVSINSGLLDYLFVVSFIALLCSAIGLLTRLSLFVSLVGFFLIIGKSISCVTGGDPTAYTPWNHSIVVFNFLILCVSPGVGRYSIDNFIKNLWGRGSQSKTAINWPIWLLKFNLVFSYFAGGIVKIKLGFDWMNGYTLQKHLLFRHLHLDTPLGLVVAEMFPLLVVASILVVVIELLFPIVLFNKKIAILILTMTLSMQGIFWLITDLRWMLFFGWAYLIYAIELVSWLLKKIPEPLK